MRIVLLSGTADPIRVEAPGFLRRINAPPGVAVPAVIHAATQTWHNWVARDPSMALMGQVVNALAARKKQKTK